MLEMQLAVVFVGSLGVATLTALLLLKKSARGSTHWILGSALATLALAAFAVTFDSNAAGIFALLGISTTGVALVARALCLLELRLAKRGRSLLNWDSLAILNAVAVFGIYPLVLAGTTTSLTLTQSWYLAPVNGILELVSGKLSVASPGLLNIPFEIPRFSVLALWLGLAATLRLAGMPKANVNLTRPTLLFSTLGMMSAIVPDRLLGFVAIATGVADGARAFCIAAALLAIQRAALTVIGSLSASLVVVLPLAGAAISLPDAGDALHWLGLAAILFLDRDQYAVPSSWSPAARSLTSIRPEAPSISTY